MNLVLLHYFGGSPNSWNPMFDAMKARGTGNLSFTPLALNSFAPGDYSVPNTAQEIFDFIESNVQEPYVLVGHSMGGKIALCLTAHGSEKLRGVVLLAPSPPTPESFNEEIRRDMLETHPAREAATRTVESVTWQELAPAVKEQAIQDNMRTPKREWENWLRTGSKEDVSSVLAKIRVPMLVVAGDHDTNMTPELMESEIVSKVSGSRLAVVEAGHLIPMEAPEATANFILDFVRSLA